MFNLVTFLKVGYSMTVRVLAPVLKEAKKEKEVNQNLSIPYFFGLTKP